MAFRVLGVDHVAITTPEELQSEVVDWYRDCLGLEVVDVPEEPSERGVWLRAGGQLLQVVIDPHHPPKRATFAFAVDDFDAAVARLREAKRHIEQAPSLPGRRRLITHDPADNRIEIVSRDEAETSVSYEEAVEGRL